MRALPLLSLLLILAAGACANVDAERDDAGTHDDGAAEDAAEALDEGGEGLPDDGTDAPDAPDAAEICTDPVCVVGETRCDPPPAEDTIFRTCVTGPDGCPRWGDQESCSSGQFCQEGACVEHCSDICAVGERQCSSSTEYQDCESGSRGCLTWGTPVACGSGLACTGDGECVTCVDACEEGLARCSTTGELLRCERETSGCLAWVTSAPCTPPQICWEGACVDSCTDVCSGGTMRCFGTDFQICMRQAVGCYGWSPPYRCPGGRACAGAGVCPSCTDACAEGEARCAGETAFDACQLDDVSGCWEWGSASPCGLHEHCEGAGVCTAICTDGCATEGLRECGPGGGPRECVVGAPGCLEWSTETPCTAVAHGTNACVAGTCELTCEPSYLACGPTACRVSCTPWTQQSPVPAYEDLWSLDFVGTRVWAAGNAGVVARSDDGGVIWRNVGVVPGAVALAGIDFVSANVGWAVGAGGAVFRSDDGGVNWTAQTSGVTAALRGLSFADATHGWAVGDAGTLLATLDGGTVWTPQTSGLTTALLGVHFVSATTGWAVGAGGRILKTANGGAAWLPQTSGSTYDIRSVRFLDADTGWAVGYYYAYRTTNGGASWAPFIRSAVQYNAVYATSANAAVIVGAAGRVETTTDGGLVWSTRTSGVTVNLHALVFLGALDALAVGQNGTVLSSANGGSTWIGRRGGTVDNLRDVHFLDATDGWAVGLAGRIVATSDGGTTWTPQTSGVTSNLWGVHFADATHGWAVGEGGVIRATTDAGATWNAQTSTTTGALYAVQFIDGSEGWAVGAYLGTSSVRYTPDGGTTWMAEPSGIPSGTTMYGVWFNASGYGWIVGATGTIRYTTNRGVAWLTPTATGTTQALWDVRFVSDTVGFAVGAAGTLVTTTDGGVRWTLRGTPAAGLLYGIEFVDATTGFVVGAAGTFLKTGDGGATWTSHPAPTSRDLRGLSFLDADHGWVAGDYGTILVTFSAGE